MRPGQFTKKNFIGVRNGHFTIVSDTGEHDEKRGYLWKAQCDCGNEFVIGSAEIRKRKSCGCRETITACRDKAESLIGSIIRDIEILKLTDERKGNYVVYLVRCTLCGREHTVPSYHIQREILSCECDEWVRKYRTKPIGRPRKAETDESVYYKHYKRGAKERGLAFELTEEEFSEITQRDCFYCGAKPRLINPVRVKQSHFYRNGIDRYDNSVGYTKENSVPCCTQCNYAKMKLNGDEFLELVERIHRHSIEKRE